MIEKVARFVYKTFFFFLPGGHPWDYVAHFIVSFIGVLAILFFLKLLNVPDKMSLYAAVAIMLIVGIAKEIYDIYLGKTDSAADMAANLLGIGIAVAVAILLIN